MEDLTKVQLYRPEQGGILQKLKQRVISAVTRQPVQQQTVAPPIPESESYVAGKKAELQAKIGGIQSEINFASSIINQLQNKPGTSGDVAAQIKDIDRAKKELVRAKAELGVIDNLSSYTYLPRENLQNMYSQQLEFEARKISVAQQAREIAESVGAARARGEVTALLGNKGEVVGYTKTTELPAQVLSGGTSQVKMADVQKYYSDISKGYLEAYRDKAGNVVYQSMRPEDAKTAGLEKIYITKEGIRLDMSRPQSLQISPQQLRELVSPTQTTFQQTSLGRQIPMTTLDQQSRQPIYQQVTPNQISMPTISERIYGNLWRSGITPAWRRIQEVGSPKNLVRVAETGVTIVGRGVHYSQSKNWPYGVRQTISKGLSNVPIRIKQDLVSPGVTITGGVIKDFELAPEITEVQEGSIYGKGIGPMITFVKEGVQEVSALPVKYTYSPYPLRGGFGVKDKFLLPGEVSVSGEEVTQAFASSREDIEQQIVRRIQKPYQDAIEKLYEEKYAPRVLTGEINYEESIKELEEDNQYRELTKQFEQQYKQEQTKSEGIKLALYKVGESFFPKTVGQASKGAAFVGALVYGAPLVPKVITNTFLGYQAATQTPKLFDKKLAWEERFIGGAIGIASATPLVIGGVRAAKDYFGARVIDTKPLVPSKQTKIRDIDFSSKPLVRGQQELIDGKWVTKDFFRVSGKREVLIPGRKTLVTSRFRQEFGLKPIYEGIPYGKSKSYSKTLKSLIKQYKPEYTKLYGKKEGLRLAEKSARETLRLYRPVSQVEIAKGRGVVTYGIGKPKSQFFVLKESKKVPQIIEGVKTRGKDSLEVLDIRKVPYKEFKGEQLFEGAIKKQTYRLTPEGRPYSRISDVGKISKKYEFVSSSKTLSDKELFGIYRTNTLTKQIIPKGRTFGTAGQISVVFKGEPSLTIREEAQYKTYKVLDLSKKKTIPVKITDEQARDIIKITKDIYGKSSQDKIVSLVKPQPSEIFTNMGPKIKSITKPYNPIQSYPRIVGGIGVKSIYAGKGTYERTSGGILPATLGSVATLSLSKPKEKQLISFKPQQISLLPQKLMIKQAPTLKIAQIPQLRIQQKPQTKLRISQELKISPALKIGLRIAPTLRITPRLTPQLRIPNVPIAPLKPIIPIIGTPKPGDIKRTRVKTRTESLTGFQVAVRRKGKYKIVSPFALGREEALSFGVREVKKGAAATFKLIPTKTKKKRRLGLKPTKEIDLLSGEFRKPKSEKGLVFIQKAPTRIKTSGEKGEITALGIKTRRNKKWWG